jgi:TRAP-type C4-dicarboxylate transport system permease large subunit
MARRLIDFAAALVGHFNGGLSYVSVLTCMMFGAISGSATAAVSSIGGFMIPEMTKKGYDRRFSVAVTTTAATTGLIIPPSNIMIVYAVVTGNISVAAMFLAGVLPGIVVGLVIMTVAGMISTHRGYGGGDRAGLRDVVAGRSPSGAQPAAGRDRAGGDSGRSLFGHRGGGDRRAVRLCPGRAGVSRGPLADLPRILLRCGITTSVIMLLVGTSQAMSWLLAYENIPQSVSTAMLGLSDNPLVILLLINILLLAVGTFMDMTPAVLIFTPIFLPVVIGLGMDPVHFGIMMIVNLCIGLCTPPVGTCLFVGCGVGRTSIAEVTRPMVPFLPGHAGRVDVDHLRTVAVVVVAANLRVS